MMYHRCMLHKVKIYKCSTNHVILPDALLTHYCGHLDSRQESAPALQWNIQMRTKWKVSFYLQPVFVKRWEVLFLGSVAVSAVSAVSAHVLLYISVGIKASFLKLGKCNICKNNITNMFLDFFKILNCSFDRGF